MEVGWTRLAARASIRPVLAQPPGSLYLSCLRFKHRTLFYTLMFVQLLCERVSNKFPLDKNDNNELFYMFNHNIQTRRNQKYMRTGFTNYSRGGRVCSCLDHTCASRKQTPSKSMLSADNTSHLDSRLDSPAAKEQMKNRLLCK